MEKKLNSLDQRTTLITEKKISDLIFDIKISLDSGTEVQNIMVPVNATAPRPTSHGQYENANLQK